MLGIDVISGEYRECGYDLTLVIDCIVCVLQIMSVLLILMVMI